jgi:hypothetical protein
MKNLRLIVSISAVAIGLVAPRVVLAQATTTPVTTPIILLHDNGKDIVQDLKGAPPAVANLIINFDALRDKYLLKQHLLLENLQNATTKEQRDAIREQLQDNRQAFLDELSDFRTQLKDELKDLKGRISNAEFLRIIDAAGDATGADHHHRGH